MKALFVELPPFKRHRAEYLDDESFSGLQDELMTDPHAGDVIKGTVGLRKVRFGDPRRGKAKRGGLRVVDYCWEAGSPSRSHIPEISMKPAQKRKTKRATRRDLFGELVEGMTALAEAREGKRTLRTHHLEFKPPPDLSADDLIRVRKRLHLSRALFANFLRTKSRTLENWEQGRARPNAQAVLLISLVNKFPDMVERLAKV